MYNFPSGVSCDLFNGFTESSKTNREQIELTCSISWSYLFYHCEAFFPPLYLETRRMWKLKTDFQSGAYKFTEQLLVGSFMGMFCDPSPKFLALSRGFAKPKERNKTFPLSFVSRWARLKISGWNVRLECFT